MSPNIATDTTVETISLDHEPSFAERWAIFIKRIYPNRVQYISDLEALLLQHGITQGSRLLDTCAGEGLPALDLIQRGWQVDALDASADMVKVYNSRSSKLGLDSRCTLGTWLDLPKLFPVGAYDLVLCHGNSFSHAPGGWNKDEASFPHADAAYRETLHNFQGMLAPGGMLYLDKSRDHDDPETSEHRELAARLNICGRVEEVFFLVEYLPGSIRRASFLRVLDDGTEIPLPNTAPLLPTSKLERLLRETGFTAMTRATVVSETPYFEGWMIK